MNQGIVEILDRIKTLEVIARTGYRRDLEKIGAPFRRVSAAEVGKISRRNG